jgi:hypothetical protein
MDMKKYVVSLLSIMLMCSAYSQGLGFLSVKGFKNTTLNLEDNVQIDSVHVKIVNQSTGEGITHVYTIDRFNRPTLEAGEYTLTCSVDGEEDWMVEGVRISAEKITFVELLYEPEEKLTFFQKRKRKRGSFRFER